MENKYISVSALNRYIAYKFDNDTNLQEVYLKGELSNFKYSGKHCYFSLKDASSEISAMFFYPGNLSLKFEPKDGMNVTVVGKVQTYQKRGSYAIIVNQMNSDGIGELYQQYLDIKEKLFKEGLFEESKKLPLPDYPNVVGIITSPTGDAIHDIISTFNRRLPLAKLKLFPALVQGADAPSDLMRALRLAYEDKTLDALIIGRGGGSFEDLSCFNSEALARLLAASPIPTVSAIGHEADYTICDFVSSYRAPTPTGAAIALTKEKRDVLDTIKQMRLRLAQSMKNKLIVDYQSLQKLNSSYGLAHYEELLENYQSNLNGFIRHLSLLSPENYVKKISLDVETYEKRIDIAFQNSLSNYQDKLNYLDRIGGVYSKQLDLINNNYLKLVDKVILLNPFNIMKKGYSILYQDQKIITSVNNLLPGEMMVKLVDGEVFSTINEIKKEEVQDGK